LLIPDGQSIGRVGMPWLWQTSRAKPPRDRRPR